MADPSSSSITPKAIGSTVKKTSDVTRQGTQKLKFVPTLPQRRKKEEIKPEPAPAAIPATAERGRGRGRGRGEGRGRGRGRGGPPVVEMTASGPFAMGPAMAGSSSRRSAPRSNFAPSLPVDASLGSNFGNLSHSAPPSLRKDANALGGSASVKAEEEEYSDPDEGVEIVDMDNVRQMDWMAPESLRKVRRDAKPKKVKKEETVDGDGTIATVDPQNALQLSESEEEEELEDIIEDFAAQSTIDSGESMLEDRLYCFLFPSPFPKFSYKESPAMDVDVEPLPVVPESSTSSKRVSFAADVKPDVTPSRTPSTVPSEPKQEQPLDGMIGQLEVYRSGTVKIRLANGILLDVSAATQPSFLQQAVVLDHDKRQLHVLGEVNKQFVVSPNIDALLTALQAEENVPVIEGEENMIKMD